MLQTIFGHVVNESIFVDNIKEIGKSKVFSEDICKGFRMLFFNPRALLLFGQIEANF